MHNVSVIRQMLEAEHSYAQCEKIVKLIGKSQKKFDDLFSLFMSNEYRISQRSAWPFAYCIEFNPKFIANHYEKLIEKISDKSNHVAVKRNILRAFQFVQIPEKFEGEIMSLCFEIIENPNEAIAVRVYALQILGNLAEIYPEIIPEIKLIICQEHFNTNAALKYSVKKFLRSK